MISYYTSKHPGLVTYISLVSLSVPAFLFADKAPLSIGIMSILWGIYTLMRCLSLYEISELFPAHHQKRASKNTNRDSSALAYDLISRMEGNNHVKRGKYAMQSIQERTLLWLSIGIAYLIATLYTQWAQTHQLSISTISETSASAFIIGSAFWAGQTYAYSQSASRILLGILATLFIGTILYHPISISAYELTSVIDSAPFRIENISYIPLTLLLIYSASIMLYACIKGIRQSAGALISISIIGVLSLYTLQTQDTQHLLALWLIGWSIVSIFWIRSFTQKKKFYILYQCE